MRRHGVAARAARIVWVAAIAVAGVSVASAQAGSAPPAGPPPLSGTIVSLNGSTIRLALADKSMKDVALQPRTLILERDTAGVGDITTGEALGVAARRDGMNLVATSINIFAAEMWASPKMGKGQWPMSNGQTMTNAEVTDSVQGMNGRTLTMKYHDVNATISVPDGIPIHRLRAVPRTALTAGMAISVRGDSAADGTLEAVSISFDGPA